MSKRKVTPHVNLLKALRAERFDPALLAAEAADNAWDAGARLFVVDFDDDAITFQDDGCGITADRVDALFVLGIHGDMATTQLGRFGVGIKMQSFNAGDRLSVDSVSRDGRLIARIDWGEMLRHDWEVEREEWFNVMPGVPTGTRLSISQLRRSKRLDIDKLRESLAEMFYPALAAGQQIKLNGVAIECLAEPAMTDIVDCEIPLNGGRSAHVRAGILCDARSKLYQVHVGYKARVIMPRCSIGCNKAHGGLSRMFARVSLSGPWELGRFKDDLPDDDERDELDAALELIFTPLLEKCRTQQQSANIDLMAEMLNAAIPPELVPASPKKKKPKGDTSGGAKGGGGPKPDVVDDAEQTAAGPVRKRRRRDELKIDFEGRANLDGVGRFERGKPHRVHLSRDDATVALFLEHGNKDVAKRALLTIALALFIHGIPDGQSEFDFGDFGLRLAHLMDAQDYSVRAA